MNMVDQVCIVMSAILQKHSTVIRNKYLNCTTQFLNPDELVLSLFSQDVNTLQLTCRAVHIPEVKQQRHTARNPKSHLKKNEKGIRCCSLVKWSLGPTFILNAVLSNVPRTVRTIVLKIFLITEWKTKNLIYTTLHKYAVYTHTWFCTTIRGHTAPQGHTLFSLAAVDMGWQRNARSVALACSAAQLYPW